MLDLNRLATFVAVVESGGFTAAGDRLGMAKSLVSQQISKLESQLGVALLTRSTRKVLLTEIGEQLYADIAPLLLAANEALDRLGQVKASGLLRITVPVDYAGAVLAPLLAEFAALHPQLEIELLATDEVLDLLAERIDVAFRLGRLQDSALHAIKLAQFAECVVASPLCVAKYPALVNPQDFSALPWVAMTRLQAPLTWRFNHGDESCTVRMRAVMRASAPSSVLALVRSGAGLSVLPDFMVADDLAAGRLVHLLPEWTMPAGGIYAVYPSARYLPAKVRILLDFMRARPMT
jgi:DNA-binding transcriptional LysR family regulator